MVDNPQSFCEKRRLQDGDSRVHSPHFTARGLGDLNRLHLSVSPYSHSSEFEEILPVFNEWDSGSVPGPVHVVDVVSQDIYESGPCSPGSHQRTLIHSHQYLDDWLVRASCQEKVLSQTQTVVQLVQDLCFVINAQMLELILMQKFTFL